MSDKARDPKHSGRPLRVVQWTTGNVARETVRAILGGMNPGSSAMLGAGIDIRFAGLPDATKAP